MDGLSHGDTSGRPVFGISFENLKGPGLSPPSPGQLDSNQDGNVTLEEYSPAWNKVLKEQFKRLGANGDTVLSKEELAKRPGPGPRS